MFHLQKMKNAVFASKDAKQHKETLLYCILGRTYRRLLSLNTNGIISSRTGYVKHNLSGFDIELRVIFGAAENYISLAPLILTPGPMVEATVQERMY